LRCGNAIEERRFGEVHGEAGVAALNPQRRLDGRGGSEGDTRTARTLVLNRGYEVLAANVAPVMGRWISDHLHSHPMLGRSRQATLFKGFER